jgi:hypothetical protein
MPIYGTDYRVYSSLWATLQDGVDYKATRDYRLGKLIMYMP